MATSQAKRTARRAAVKVGRRRAKVIAREIFDLIGDDSEALEIVLAAARLMAIRRREN